MVGVMKDFGQLTPFLFFSQEIRAVMSEYKIVSADIAFRCDATIDDLIDVIEERSRRYIPVIYALNKIDAITIEELDLLYRIPHSVPISSEKACFVLFGLACRAGLTLKQGWNVDELLEMMYGMCCPRFTVY